jgi:hypothetical protein
MWRAFAALLTVFVTLGLVQSAAAQDEDLPEFRYIPKTELAEEDKETLERERDLKKYTRLAVSMMEARLAAAEARNSEGAYRDCLDSLGRFEGVMTAALRHLTANAAGRRNLDNLKRFEIALRGFAPRIETVRREVPGPYEYYVLRLLRSVREARTRAVEPFFGETDNR